LKVHYSLDNLPNFNEAVLTIGAFDGVHHGHRAIIKKVIDKAKNVGGESIVMTFYPHPRKVVFPNDKSLRLISTLEEKIKLLDSCGVDHLIIAPFTVEFSQINPYVYTDKILIEKIKAKHIVIGYDHKFGLNRSGDINLLKAYAEEGHFTLDEIPEQEIDNLKVSSSKIRKHLLEGQVEKANIQLEHPFMLTGKIIKGMNLAGSMGYPTANINVSDTDKLIPVYGTYAAQCILDNIRYNGMVYIGESKTLVSEKRLTVEMNIFHQFEETFYDHHLEVQLLKFIRPDQVFDNKEELMSNIELDKIACENFFKFEFQPSSVKVSIAVLNWNGKIHLQEYLSSLSDSSESPFDTIVIDNGSTDDSISYLRANHPEVQIIELAENVGFAGGYNKGIEQINTPYVALVNSDVRGAKNWLTPLINCLDHKPNIGSVQPKILSDKARDQFEYAGASGGYLDILGYPVCRGRMFDHQEKDLGQYDDYQEIFWSTGAAMVMRTDVFRLIGGFDSDFFAHMEEIDLCWRIKKLGIGIAVEPSSTVYHLGGGTLTYESPRKTYLNFRNNWWMLLKNEPISKLLWLIPLRWSLDIIFGLKALFKLDWTLFTIFRAHFAVIKSLKSISQKRKKIQHIQSRFGKTENVTGRLKMATPFHYFLLGKKKFSQL
jgi:riboflavin kinase/FMN adenylyltransferase